MDKAIQTENDLLLIKKIEMSKDYEWLKKMLKANYNFTEEVIKTISNINSLEIQQLLDENYRTEG